MTHPTHSPELVEAVARALDPYAFEEKTRKKKANDPPNIFLETRIESDLRLAKTALTAAEPFIVARVEAAVLAERKACYWICGRCRNPWIK